MMIKPEIMDALQKHTSCKSPEEMLAFLIQYYYLLGWADAGEISFNRMRELLGLSHISIRMLVPTLFLEVERTYEEIEGPGLTTEGVLDFLDKLTPAENDALLRRSGILDDQGQLAEKYRAPSDKQ